MKVGALGASACLSGFLTGTADTLVKTEAQKDGGCEATTGLMSALPEKFCLRMTIDKDPISKAELKGYVESEWSAVTIPEILKTYYASGLEDPILASFAFIVKEGIGKEGEIGKFAYKNAAGEVQHTGKFDLVQGKELCFKKDGVEKDSFAGGDSKMLDITEKRARNIFHSRMFKTDASRFAWIAPVDNPPSPGAFVYKLNSGKFQKFDLNKDLTTEANAISA